MEALAAAYGLVADPRTRFTHLFLNVVPEAQLRQRPSQVQPMSRAPFPIACCSTSEDLLWSRGYLPMLMRTSWQVKHTAGSRGS